MASGSTPSPSADAAAPRAVFLDALSLGPVDLAPIAAEAHLRCWPSTSLEERLPRLQGAEVAITNKVPLDGPLLAQLPQLRLICTASTGTDQLDLRACEARGITVRHAGRYSQPSVVQITWALILELTCQLQLRREQVHSGAWQRSPVFALVEPAFDELAGGTLTVVGAGDIGRGVAAVGEAFGMTVRSITSRTPPQELEAALRQADVVSLHAPLTAASRHLINAERLAWMKATAVLVNMGRGGLIDTPALVRALQEEQLAGAALDVLEREPPGPELEPLKSVPNLILTPHIGWASRQARQRLVATLAAHLAAYRESR
ncbi:NAD(P)-dependent oxidoreductase [Cyanobium sp. NIES-981]|uniref:NAD(P)-dependent oxidoreductase n=1 Tax=Cyanobium sp. NIES-981 TaxID=1851505 RepID=UPI000B3557BE|nr:NAD(P)-dependent oxidoreductase [Cyanobium sp. NIES-981]